MTPDVRSPEDEMLQLARLRQYFTALTPLTCFFVLLYGGGGLFFHSRMLLLNSGIAAMLAGSVLLAQRLARRGHLAASASTVGYGLLAVAATNVLVLPFIYPTLVLVCVMAVITVLPHLKGPPLHLFLATSLAVIIENAGVGMLLDHPLDEVPQGLGRFISLSTMAAGAFLTLLLLWQLSSRLLLSLNQTLATNAALRLAQEREKAAREIAEATEKEYRHLAAAIPQQVWTALPNGELDFVNQRCHEYFQLPEGSVLGEGWHSVIHPEDRPGCLERWTHSLATGESYEVEFRLRRVDGAYRWHLGRAIAMRDREGRIARWFGTNTDIHDQKETQKALRASEERFRSLTVATTQIVWTTDPDGQVMEDSPSWRAFTGQTYEQCRGSGWVEAIHPEDRKRVARTWRDAVGRKAFYETEYRVRRKDGSYADMVIRATPVLNEDGSLREWVGTNTDITERKQAEERLREESRALRESEERARDADRRKDEFLAMLGHELRNPLAPILATLDLLRLRQRGELGKEHAIIDRQVRHVTRLVDDLLDVSRITRGKIQLKKEPLELSLAVDRALEISRPLIEQRQHRVTVQVPREGLRVEADPVRLAQVIANLLTNAAKYTDPGGHITIASGRDAGSAVVKVIDTGSGIPAPLLPHLFELFVQGDRSLDRSQGGLGIGLTLVKMLVELHGGSVAALSEGVGKGSEFQVRLPMLQEQASAAPVQSTAEGRAGPEHCRILVVDDNVDAAEVLAECLQLSGHQVRVANDGPVALSVAAEFEPEVVLLDIGLPSMDGFEVARRLRQRHGSAPLRLIALTGYGQESDRQRARAAGFDEHMVKPVELDALTATLARIAPQHAPHPAKVGT